MLVDVNLLIYASHSDSPEYIRAKAWLDGLLASGVPVEISWFGLVAFVRIMTNPRLFREPLSLAEALRRVRTLLDSGNVKVLEPGPDHLRYFESACRSANATGNLVTDAHLAALAMEHNRELASADADFARFPGLRWVNPLAPAE